jgi:hypothetical protein
MTTVELLDLIKSRLEKTEKEPIVKALGYINKQKGLKRLDALIYTNSTEDWLRKSGYDLVHSNKSFLIKLCDVLGFDEDSCLKIIKKTTERLNAIDRMPAPYIFINTNFRRGNQPIFALAFMEGVRRISIDKVKVFDSSDDGLSIAKKLVKKHYQKTQGTIKMWGKIDNYIYYANDKKYIINKAGEIENDEIEIFESKAVLSIGNRPITFLSIE